MMQPDPETPAPLLILCPPRSFSSVVCAMLGQHPEMYGFPELRLFVADTVEELLEHAEGQKANLGLTKPFPPGLLRALAELHYGGQSAEAVARAEAWLLSRRGWSVRQVFDSLLERVRPRVGVDKSPLTAMSTDCMRRALRLYPAARFLHLTRHPVATQRSMQTHWQARFQKLHAEWDGCTFANHCARLWYATHRGILDFTRRLSPDQVHQVRGEDLLSEPDRYLAGIASWLGARTDPAAVEAMKHPERSPYAGIGPESARAGNDPKFLQDPRLRPATTLVSPEAPPDWGLEPHLQEAISELATQLRYAESEDKDPAALPPVTSETGS